MEDVLNEGKDLENFLWEMIKHTKDILMYKVSKREEIYNEEELKQIEEIANNTSKEELINIIYKLSELENKMKTSSQKTIIFETEIIKLCAKLNNTEVTSAITSAKADTKKEEQIKKTTPVSEEAKAIRQEPVTSAPAPVSVLTKAQTVSQKLEPGEKIANWQSAIDNLKKQGKVMLYANLIGTDAVEINDMTVEIRFYNGLNAFRKELIQKPENMNALIKEVSVICQKPMGVKLKDASGENKTQKSAPISKAMQTQNSTASVEKNHLAPETPNTPEKVFEDLGIEINFIDEE